MVKKLLALVLFALCAWLLWENKENIMPRKKTHELVFWTIQLKPVCDDIIQKNIAEFERKHPEITVTWVDIPIAEAQKRTLASILSSSPPDLVNLNPDFSMLLAERGALDFFDINELKDFHPKLLEALKYGENVFGIPYYATSSVTLYNKKAYDACSDASLPKTYDDVLDTVAPQLTKCSKNSTLTVNLNENDTLARILAKYDVASFNDSESLALTRKIFEMFKNAYDKGYIPKDSLTLNHREVIEKYMSKNTTFVVVGSNFIKMVQENARDTYEDSAVMPQLTGKNGEYDVALMNFVIPKHAAHRALAKEFALQLTSQDNQLEFAKLTNVLPANNLALEDEYFNKCSDDLVDRARCVSKKQLDNLTSKNFGYKNKKAINDTLNRALEGYILNGEGNLENMAKAIKALQE